MYIYIVSYAIRKVYTNGQLIVFCSLDISQFFASPVNLPIFHLAGLYPRPSTWKEVIFSLIAGLQNYYPSFFTNLGCLLQNYGE